MQLSKSYAEGVKQLISKLYNFSRIEKWFLYFPSHLNYGKADFMFTDHPPPQFPCDDWNQEVLSIYYIGKCMKNAFQGMFRWLLVYGQ